MTEPWDVPESADRDGPASGPPVDWPATEPAPPAVPVVTGSSATQVAELWRMLGASYQGHEPGVANAGPSVDAAELAAGWDRPDLQGGAAWEVAPLPTAAEGGIAALFTARSDLAARSDTGATQSDAATPKPDHGPTAAAMQAPSLPPPFGSTPPSWGLSQLTGNGRTRLAEMLDQLPDTPTPRVTPADMHVDAPMLAPVAVWFWGDDDIYAGRIASRARPGSSTSRLGSNKRGRRRAAQPAQSATPAAQPSGRNAPPPPAPDPVPAKRRFRLR